MALGRIREANATDSPYSDRLVIAGLVKLCLTLVGEMPNHWDEKAVRRNECFLLDKVRSVHYSQSAKQKSEVVMRFLLKRVNSLPTDKDDEKNSIWEIIRHYHAHYARYHKHADFLCWFKENYPEDYVSLFLP